MKLELKREEIQKLNDEQLKAVDGASEVISEACGYGYNGHY